jgi:hypothetical protein
LDLFCTSELPEKVPPKIKIINSDSRPTIMKKKRLGVIASSPFL